LRYLFIHTCKQSKDVLTMRGHLDWHANSKGKKYLSASIKLVFDFTGGRVLDPTFVSPWGGLNEKQVGLKHDIYFSMINIKQNLARFINERV
jgi:hypothetical protein